jgi:hypothetical protein
METPAASSAPIQLYEYVPSINPTKTSGSRKDWCLVSHHPELPAPVTACSVVTWNVWFDKLEQESRFQGALKELLSLPSVDLICLQEVTPQFIEWLQLSADIRAEWLMTDCWDAYHQAEIPPNWYGCIFLVNKKWAGNIRGWVRKFPTSKMGRFVIMAEVFQGHASLVYLPFA